MDSALSWLRMTWYGLGMPPVYLHSSLVGLPDGRDTFSTEAELEQFLTQHFLFFSYRKDFTPLRSPSGGISTDSGWGCLVRATQMLMAHCLIRHHLHPDPLKLFRDLDDPRAAPFGIHALSHHAYTHRPFKAEYWSPSQGCEALEHALEAAVRDGTLPAHVAAVTSVCGTLFAGEVEPLLAVTNRRTTVMPTVDPPFTTQTTIRGEREAGVAQTTLEVRTSQAAPPSHPDPAVLILLPIRVSARRVMDQTAFEQISGLMQLHTCLGAVGGTNSRSFYFLGCCQHQMLLLDPHLEVQPAMIDITEAGHTTPTLFHLKALPFGQVSTTLFIAFMVHTPEEWLALRTALSRLPFVNVEDGIRPKELCRLMQPSSGFVSLEELADHACDDVSWQAL